MLLSCLIGTRNCSACNAGVSGLISQRAGRLIIFLELRRDPGVCSRVTARVDISNFVCLVTSGLLSSSDGHLRNLHYAWQDNTDASGGEAGDQGSLSSWHTDFGIPIHFQKESGIVTF